MDSLAEDPKFWQDKDQAQDLMRERNHLESSIKSIGSIEHEFYENIELLELGENEDDAVIVAEAEQSIQNLQIQVNTEKIKALLSGDADHNDCYLEIHSGAGGTEAQDWAQMLQRMYLRWCEKRNYRLDFLEESAGEEAGIKSCTIRVRGQDAYGWLKAESGVHRLVRISPFDSGARRHTSFASVGIFPVIDEDIEVIIDDKDLRIDTYRASGAGGQHVNKTDSAVRITHIPLGIVVQCQTDRSQHRNRATAFDMLRAKIYEVEKQKRDEEAQATRDAKTDIGWGHQIRSYVMQPYQLVKDLRTSSETSNVQSVLDGDIDQFLVEALADREIGT